MAKNVTMKKGETIIKCSQDHVEHFESNGFAIHDTKSEPKKTDKTKEYEGKTYPYYTVEVSSASHPFYTGKQKIIDSGGRVQKFEERFGKKK